MSAAIAHAVGEPVAFSTRDRARRFLARARKAGLHEDTMFDLARLGGGVDFERMVEAEIDAEEKCADERDDDGD